jgi:acyl-homoserine-lactone acylase
VTDYLIYQSSINPSKLHALSLETSMKMNRREAVLLTLATMLDHPALALAKQSSPPSAVAPNASDALANQVTIYRDEYGVPHIVGESEEAAFFGYGYAQAEDHLERMMTQYRDAQGRRAEVLGFDALGNGYLHFIPYEYRWDGDYLQRLLRTKQCVVDNRAKIDPDVYKILDAFSRGVNYYIAEHRNETPAWIDGITAEDVEALERSHYLRFYSIHDALMKISEQTWSFPGFGSNQWAIAPEKSANGRVIHLEETHMPWANRFQNYEAHLFVPGKLNAGGISWFGSPFFLDGFNDKITWSATWNQPNISDVYEEKLNPNGELQYLYEGEWREIQVETATFRIKGPRELESVTLPLYYTHHGPIVKVDKEKQRAWSVRLPNFDGVNYSLGLYGLMKARNLDDFKAHVARQLMPRWNLLCSDAKNIYWVHNGNVPERSEKYNWLKPVPGWTKETEWGPNIPFEKYPQITNPPAGFLQNCNNPFWVSTPDSGLRPLELGPYYLSYAVKADAGKEALNPRGERATQVLSEKRKFTQADMVELGYDTYILPADVIVPLLAEAAHSHSSDTQLAQPLASIKAWNRRSAANSLATTYLYYWAKTYKELFTDAKYERFVAYDRHTIDIHSAEEQKMAWTAFAEAITRIEKKFGSVEVPWGKINVVVRGGVFPMDGASVELFGVLHPDEGPEQDNGQIYCNDGWGHFMVVVEADPDNGTGKEVWSLLPYGESEHPSSPHFNDLTKLHSEHRLKRFWLTPEEILEHSESVWGDKARLHRIASKAQR